MKRFVLAALLLAFPALAQVANVFTPTAQNTITATSSSSNIAFPDPNAPGILVTNTGSVVAYVRLGNSSVVAATTDKPINAGQYLWFASSGNTNIASITSGGGTSILVQSGTGTPNISYNASTSGSKPAPATPKAATASAIVAGGAATTLVTGPVNGCWIVNPLSATDQAIATAETAVVNGVTTAAAPGNSTNVTLQPGQSWGCTPGQTTNVSAIAATTGHAFAVEVW